MENFDGKTVNLRLSDKSGEVFQYPLPTKGLAPGWHLVSLRVEKSGAPARGIWSGDQNRKLDFPVRLAGFSVGIAEKSDLIDASALQPGDVLRHSRHL